MFKQIAGIGVYVNDTDQQKVRLPGTFPLPLVHTREIAYRQTGNFPARMRIDLLSSRFGEAGKVMMKSQSCDFRTFLLEGLL
jgi:hypothetical protein